MKKNKKRKGSSTILVILIVITVVLFGVMNMMTIYTSYKISKKNLDWTKSYYEMDSKANIFANTIKKQISKTARGEKINTVNLLNKVETSVDKNTQIIINNKLVQIPIDKNNIIDKDGYINLETYFLDDNGIQRFYTNLKIPQIRAEKEFYIISWKRVNQNFEYKELDFAEKEEVVSQ